jgi:hypothetical protein
MMVVLVWWGRRRKFKEGAQPKFVLAIRPQIQSIFIYTTLLHSLLHMTSHFSPYITISPQGGPSSISLLFLA